MRPQRLLISAMWIITIWLLITPTIWNPTLLIYPFFILRTSPIVWQTSVPFAIIFGISITSMFLDTK